ncbi:MAG: FtsW/RodA/SpoVE family cell cycle protein [Bacteroidia bacterium]|nr:FtsW/RodA/SpoVE family cell cycle protein [Bacteroidia bacterium]
MKFIRLRIQENFSYYFQGDLVIWMVIIGLSVFSLLAVYSSTGTLAYQCQSGNTFYYILKHFLFQIFGISVVFGAHLVPYRYYSRLAQLFFYISIPLLLITLIIGTTKNEASRWLTLPEEVIKDYKEAFKPMIIVILITCVLILPANLSTAVLLFITSLVLLFIGRVNLKYYFSFIVIALVIVSIFGLLIWYYPDIVPRGATWKNRLKEFYSPGENSNYQAEQAKIAVVTGGIFGKMPGNSTQRNFLPYPYSDFIYAIIIEEYGIIGGIIILLLYLILLYRAVIIVKKCTSQFGAFVTIGLCLSLVFQALLNMAVAVTLIPTTGQTLPLVSMGGTSILFTCIALGIMLSVSKGAIIGTNIKNNAE